MGGATFRADEVLGALDAGILVVMRYGSAGAGAAACHHSDLHRRWWCWRGSWCRRRRSLRERGEEERHCRGTFFCVGDVVCCRLL